MKRTARIARGVCVMAVFVTWLGVAGCSSSPTTQSASTTRPREVAASARGAAPATARTPAEQLAALAEQESRSRARPVKASAVALPPGVEPGALQERPENDPRARMSLDEAIVSITAVQPPEGRDAAASAPAEPSPEDAAESLRLYAQGRLALLDGRTLIAIMNLQQALALAPGSPEILRHLARAFDADRQPLKAAEAYRQLLAGSPNDLEALFEVGLAQEGARDMQAALRTLARLHRLQMEDESQTLNPMLVAVTGAAFANCLRENGYDRAFIELARGVAPIIEAISPQPGVHPRLAMLYRQRAETWRGVGDAHMRLNEPEAALDAYAQAAALPAADTGALTPRMVYASLRLGRPHGARLALWQALEAGGESPPERLIQMGAYVADHAPPVDLLCTAVDQQYQAHPESSGLARAVAALSDRDGQVRVLRDFLARRPADFAVASQVLAWLAADDPASAARSVLAWSEDHPAYASAYADRLAVSSPNLVHTIRAVRTLKPSPARARLEAHLHSTLGALGEAWTVCAAARAQWPDDAGLYQEHLDLVRVLGEPALLDAVLRSGESHEDVTSIIARVRALRSLERIEQAVQEIDRAAETHPDQVAVLVEAARCHLVQSTVYGPVTPPSVPGTDSGGREAQPVSGKAGQARAEALKAETLARRALAVSPADDDALEVMIALLGPRGTLADGQALRDMLRQAAGVRPSSPLLSRLAAQEAMGQNRFESAVDRLLNNYASDATDLASLRLAVAAWQQWDQVPRAEAWLEERLARQPVDPALLEQWVRMQILQKEESPAIQRLEQVVADAPEHAAARRLLEVLYKSAGRPEDAKRMALERLDARPEAPGREIERAGVLLDAGDEAPARAALQWAADHGERAGLAQMQLAMQTADRLPGEESTREQLVHQFAELGLATRREAPMATYARLMLACARLQHQDYETLVRQAVEHSTDGSGYDNASILAWQQAAQLLTDGGHPAVAGEIIRLRAQLGCDQMTPQALGFLVSVSVTAYAAAGAGGETHADQVLAMLNALSERGCLDAMALADDVPIQAAIMYSASNTLSIVGDDRGAEQLLRESLKLHEDQPMAMNNLGYLLAERDVNNAETVTMIERAALAEPNDANILDSLGWLRYKQGQVEDQGADAGAVTLLQRAAEAGRAPSAEVLDHLGDALWRAGRKEDARNAWTRAAAVLNDQSQRQVLLQNLRMVQVQQWGLVVATPQTLYDRQYSHVRDRVEAKLKALDASEPPPVAPTFAEHSVDR